MKKIILLLTVLGLLSAPALAQLGCQNYYNGATYLGCLKNWKADGVTITCTATGQTVTCSSVGGGAVGLSGAYNSAVVAADNNVQITAAKGTVIFTGTGGVTPVVQINDGSFVTEWVANGIMRPSVDFGEQLGDSNHRFFSLDVGPITASSVAFTTAAAFQLTGAASAATMRFDSQTTNGANATMISLEANIPGGCTTAGCTLLGLSNRGGLDINLVLQSDASWGWIWANRITEKSGVADGASAIAETHDTANTLSTAGALLSSWRNNTTTEAILDKDGKLGLGSATSPGATQLLIDPVATSSGTPVTSITVTAPANTAQTAGTENTQINFNLSATRQWATGALTTQREVRYQAPTYTAVGASTFTTASTVDISGPPIASTNVTITNPWALLIDAGNIGMADGTGISATASNSKVQVNNAQGTLVTYGANQFIKVASATTQLHSAATDGAGAVALTVDTQNAYATAGAVLIRALSTANTDLGIGAFSGDGAFPCSVWMLVQADAGGITAGKVVVWSANTAKAQDAGLAANLTTIAGVAMTAAAAAAYAKVCVLGKVKTNCDAGVAAGNLVGTSGAAAGSVAAGAPGAGAIVGRALEATGTTTAAKCYVDVDKG